MSKERIQVSSKERKRRGKERRGEEGEVRKRVNKRGIGYDREERRVE